MSRLPTPTPDLARCKSDLDEHGYCLLAGALSAGEVAALRARLLEQAEAEGKAGLSWIGDGTQYNRTAGAYADSSTPWQIVRSLLNKGRVFHDTIVNPKLLELFGHLLRPEFYCLSTNAILMRRGSKQQLFHADQQYVPCATPVPFVANTLIMITDFDAGNGGTRVVPGSHRRERYPRIDVVMENEKPVSLRDGDPNDDAVSAEGPAGTALVFDGRLWHAGGANTSGELRLALSIYYGLPFVRQQDLLPLSVTDQALAQMSHELKEMIGFRSATGLGRIDAALGRTNSNESFPLIPEMRP